MRILGLDIGNATIGIAVSDALGITAQGVETYRRINNKADIDYIINMINDYQAEVVVYGLPLHLSGDMSEQGQVTEDFIKKLKKKTTYSSRLNHAVELIAVDERFTTSQANRMMKDGGLKRKKRDQIVDMIAAQLILESYLAGR